MVFRRRNLFDRATCEMIRRRVTKLSPDVAAHWGSMTAAAMLYHCNEIHHALLEPSQNQAPPSRFWGGVMLFLLPRLPRHIKNVSGVGDVAPGCVNNFSAEKQRFLQLLDRLATHRQPIMRPHPRFGGLTVRQWGRFLYLHADHHLRQFGA